MRDWKAVLIGGAALILCGCSQPAAPKVPSGLIKAEIGKASACENGYFVMWGAHGDSTCVQP